MLDIKFIRENPKKVKAGIKKKGFDFDVERFLALDKKRRELIQLVEKLRAEQKKASAKVSKGSTKLEELLPLAELKKRIKRRESELGALDKEFNGFMLQIPNLPLDEVPEGKSERDNVALREVGEKPKFNFEPKDHLAIGEALGIIDFNAGSKVAGSGFYYLKSAGAILELALVQYALDYLAKKGFLSVVTPDLARERFYLGTGYSPKGSEAQTYQIAGTDLGLIATAEVTLAGLHSDETIDGARLPLRYAGYSHCFRQEAGSYGKYSKGLYRVHQFTKVEMFVYSRPKDSPKIHQELLAEEEAIWQGLGIPYRVLEICAADLGAQAARKFDIEAWMPGRGDWGEVTSASNTTDYQARRLGIKYRDSKGNLEFAHTLNGTAIATSRAIIAILENYQNEDGSVRVPDALLPYMRGIAAIQR